MQLSDAQSDKVRQWIDSGSSLAEIQVRLDKEDGLRLSYMDVKFLVDDLKLLPKDPVEAPKEIPPGAAAAAATGGRPPGAAGPNPAGGASAYPEAGGEDFGTGEPLSPDSPYEDPLTAFGEGGQPPAHEPAFPGDPGADAGGGPSDVQVQVDQITRPGAMVSGHVVFSDGVRAEWYLDQMGRFGLVPPTPGYRPSNGDLQAFQLLLDRELQKIGY